MDKDYKNFGERMGSFEMSLDLSDEQNTNDNNDNNDNNDQIFNKGKKIIDNILKR